MLTVSRSSARAALVAALLLGLGCRGLPQEGSAIPRTEDAVWIALPVVPQEAEHECGVATLATLCGYYGVPLPPSEHERLSTIAEEHDGLTAGELRAALRGLGLEAFLFHGRLDHGETGLYRHVDRGRPALVMVSPDGEAIHYCLFTGYDQVAQVVYLYDPRRGHLCLPVADFEPLWANASRCTLLALPPVAGDEAVARL